MPPPRRNRRNTRTIDESTEITPEDILNMIASNYSQLENEEINQNEEEDEVEDISKWPYEEIKRDVKDINDLIELAKLYDPNKKVRYNINLKKINDILEPLIQLRDMIGLEDVKKNIVGHIIFYIQDLGGPYHDMMHTRIEGSPGVGKTMLGRILGDIYFKLGILKGNKKRNRLGEKKYNFRIVKRSELIGKYLGHTAAQTQEVIDSVDGGVLFIDEAYSLGNPEGRDSFSKECLDTINQNLTEKKANFLCIIAGYKDALDKCFFKYNEGLARRFTFRYTIEDYTPEQLKEIFQKMVGDIEWQVEDKLPLEDFFKENYDCFKNMGGDIETLLFNCKIEHGKRVFCDTENKRILNLEDIKNGFEIFTSNRKQKEESTKWHDMYN